jgi:hypothetical protein
MSDRIENVRQRHTLRELQIADRMWPIGEQVEYASVAVDDIRFLLDALATRDAEIERLKAAMEAVQEMVACDGMTGW